MNKALFLLFLIPVSFSALLYTVEADRSGSCSVILSMEDSRETNVTLPSDATDLRIVGGSYSLDGDSAVVAPGQSGFTTFSFSTALFTAKTGSGWRLTFSPPSDAVIRIAMPPHAVLEGSTPQPKTVTAEDSRTLIEFDPSENVDIYYHLEEMPAPAAESGLYTYLLIGAIIVLAAVLLSSMIRSKQLSGPSEATGPENPPTLSITAGKKEMMETFNENDIRIVRFLMDNDGKSRRNELERRSGLSKSSLAMALNRLEKRKIVAIDRTATTHFVKLSDYFLKL